MDCPHWSTGLHIPSFPILPRPPALVPSLGMVVLYFTQMASRKI